MTTMIPVGVSRPDLGLVQADEVVRDDTRRTTGLAAAAEWIRDQQWPSLANERPTTADIRRWVDEPLDLLAVGLRGRRARSGLAALRRRLGRELAGQSVVVADVAGSISLRRWWLAADGSEVAVVDAWRPAERGLAEVDVVLLVLAAHHVQDPSTGTTETVRRLLDHGWSDEDRLALGADWQTNAALRPSTVLLLAWLQSVSSHPTEDGGPEGRLGAADRRALRRLLEAFAPGGRRRAQPDEDRLRIAPDHVPTETAASVTGITGPTRPAGTRATTTDFAGEPGQPAEPRSVELRPEARPTSGGPGRPRRPSDASARDRSQAALDAAAVRAADRSVQRRSDRLTAWGVIVGVALWLTGVWGLDPGKMTDLGLLSILRPTAYLGLGVLLATFARELASPHLRTRRIAAPLVALVAVLHGTPAWLYGTLRYSWAWKHLGIVDYIHRHGAVNPHAGSLDVYHNWPGFFAVNSVLVDLFGIHSAVQYARWWPVGANLAAIPAVLFVYRSLDGGHDRRRAWLAAGLFTVCNWIGQDYFSPQSMGFLLYLVIVGVILRGGEALEAGDRRSTQRWAFAVAVVAAAAIVTSHQVTPIVLVASLAALAAVRRNRRRALALLGVILAMAAVWAATGARPFVATNLADLFEGLGEPVANADANLVDQGALSHPQVLVSTMGRVVLGGIVLLAAIGFLRAWRRRGIDRAAVALTAAPAALLLANRFGGEIGFRAYLFALPLLAWFAADAISHPTTTWRPAAGRETTGRPGRLIQAGVITVAMSVLLAGFLFGYYGKDRWYHFSGGEVAASAYVLDRAPAHSLLVTVTADYPGQFEKYEDLVYVPITGESGSSVRRILRDPATVLGGWLSDQRYEAGYILLTRSQEAETEALGVLPKGSVARLRRALDASPKFRVAFATPDAQVYVLASRAGDDRDS